MGAGVGAEPGVGAGSDVGPGAGAGAGVGSLQWWSPAGTGPSLWVGS